MIQVEQHTQMLNQDGGIEADLTVVCFNKDHFRIITSAANRKRQVSYFKVSFRRY